MFPSRWTVDELRGSWAVLQSGSFLFTVPRAVLPAGTRLDDALRSTGERVGAYPVWLRASGSRRGDRGRGQGNVTIPERLRLKDGALEGTAAHRAGGSAKSRDPAGFEWRVLTGEKTTSPPDRIRVIQPD